MAGYQTGPVQGPRQDSGQADERAQRTPGDGMEISQIAVTAGRRVAVAGRGRSFPVRRRAVGNACFRRADNASWAVRDVRGVAFDSEGRLWFASPQGVGCLGEASGS